MKKYLFSYTLLLLFSLSAFCQSDPVKDFISQYMEKKQIPGIALLVRKDGKVVRSEGYGFANLEHNVPVTSSTVFQSGSVGKQFAATAVMMLAEEGKLSLDDPVSKHLEVPESWERIRIHHLLTHTSGLGDYPEDFSLQKDYTEHEVFKMVTSQPVAFAPGEKWSYSNLGYVTLGVLIGKVAGKFYGDFLSERVFQPLGMKSTRVISEADIIPNRAAGYRLSKGEVKNQEWVSPGVNSTADGSLYFTIADLKAWDEALDAATVLRKDSLARMWTPVTLANGSTEPYGFGWKVGKTKNQHTLIEHGGAWQGFSTHIARYPEDRLSVIVLCNLAGADPTYIAHRVAGIYIPEIGPEKRVPRQVSLEILKSYEGKYRYEDRFTIEITAAGDRLTFELLGQRLEMIPESEVDFFEEDSERTIAFERDNAGTVTAFILKVPVALRFVRLQN